MISNKAVLEQGKISALCFSPNFQFCAIALKSNNNILVYEVPPNSAWDINKWVLKKTLKEPTQNISSLDWSVKDKIMAGSYDRSLTIWQKKGDSYSKQLANLSNKLSIICASWSPNGNKFAIGTSCKSVFNFWSGLLLKSKDSNPLQSTVNAISFHKSGNLLGVGSTDFSFRVVTCSLANQNVTTQADKGADKYQGTYGNINTFGEVLLIIPNLEGWINNISFANDVNEVVVIPHNNSVYTYTIPEAKDHQPIQKEINWRTLPLLSGFYLNDTLYAAGGFDRSVTIFQRSANGLEVAKTLETSVAQKMDSSEKKGGLVSGMKGIWDKQAVTKMDQKLNAQQSNTQHKGAIKLVRYGNQICSYDVNGDINFWEA